MSKKGKGSDNYYKVGYKKPPEEHQFKKGEPSPNPKGRKRGSRNVPSLFRDVLEEKVLITEGGKMKRITVQEAIVRRSCAEALKGKDKAIERALLYAPHTEAEENRYTIEELANMLKWNAMNDDELHIIMRLFGLDKPSG